MRAFFFLPTISMNSSRCVVIHGFEPLYECRTIVSNCTGASCTSHNKLKHLSIDEDGLVHREFYRNQQLNPNSLAILLTRKE